MLKDKMCIDLHAHPVTPICYDSAAKLLKGEKG